jgi:hypothetical protein
MTHQDPIAAIELAFELKHDLPPRTAPYSDAEIDAAVVTTRQNTPMAIPVRDFIGWLIFCRCKVSVCGRVSRSLRDRMLACLNYQWIKLSPSAMVT